MIRKSAGIGAAALVLSLVIHFFGISLTFSTRAPPTSFDSAAETVALGETFDDLVEFRAEPVTPEQVEQPEPYEESPPEPEEAEAPTSQALVASPDPQRTPSPDTGRSQPVQPDISGPVTPESGDTPDPETTTPSAGEESGVSDARITPPVSLDGQSTPAQGDPAGEPETAAAEAAEPPATTQPVAAEPTPPTTEVPSPAIIAALPPELLTPVPEDVQQPAATTQEDADDEDPKERVTTSLRPQLRPEQLTSQVLGIANGTADQNNNQQARSEIIESPLTAYARDGTNLFAGRSGGRQSGGQGFGGGRGPGNSDVTNYAGLVLVHLNRTPPVAISTPGWARVVFRINPDGTLASVDIIDGSGTPEIDRAAKEQTRRGEPFPRPPGGKSRLMNFVYQIQ